MNAPLRRRRGFTLTEMIAILILLSAFAIVGGRLFQGTFHIYYDTTEAQNAGASIDSTLTRLRDDVWSAAQIKSTDPHQAELTAPDGKSVTWTIKDNIMTRKSAATNESLHAPPGASFSTDGVVLTLKVDGGKNATAFDEIPMASEVNLLAKVAP